MWNQSRDDFSYPKYSTIQMQNLFSLLLGGYGDRKSGKVVRLKKKIDEFERFSTFSFRSRRFFIYSDSESFR